METTTTTNAPAASTKPAKAVRTGKKIERTPLKAICKALRIEPKAARRKLRKAAGLSFHAARERWTFTEAQAAKVREILKPGKAKPEAKAADEPTKQ